MIKRIAIILFPVLLLVIGLGLLTLNQFSTRLPPEAIEVIDAYRESSYPNGTLTTIMYARNREKFTADLGRYLTHSPKIDFQISPVLYNSDIIHPPEETSYFPFPAQEVWCVKLASPTNSAELFFLARYDNLYSETWVLYQSQTGLSPAKSIGCASP